MITITSINASIINTHSYCWIATRRHLSRYLPPYLPPLLEFYHLPVQNPGVGALCPPNRPPVLGWPDDQVARQHVLVPIAHDDRLACLEAVGWLASSLVTVCPPIFPPYVFLYTFSPSSLPMAHVGARHGDLDMIAAKRI